MQITSNGSKCTAAKHHESLYYTALKYSRKTPEQTDGNGVTAERL